MFGFHIFGFGSVGFEPTLRQMRVWPSDSGPSWVKTSTLWNFKLLLHFHMKLSNILLAIPVAKFTHLQTFEYEIVNDIHNKNECGVGQ